MEPPTGASRSLQTLRVLVGLAWGWAIAFAVADMWLGHTSGQAELAALVPGGIGGWLLRNGGIPRVAAKWGGVLCVAAIVAIIAYTWSLPPADEMGGYAQILIALCGVAGCVGAWISLLFFIQWIPPTQSKNTP